MHQHIAHKPRSGTHCNPGHGQHSQTPTLSGLKIGPWHAATTSPALDSPGCQITSLLESQDFMDPVQPCACQALLSYAWL